MDKKKMNILIGVGLAIIVIILIHNEMQKREAYIRRLIDQGQAMEVVVSNQDIPPETKIDRDMVRLETVSSKSFQRGDLTSLESVVGKITIIDILKDQHINSNMLRGISNIRYLSQGIPEGLRAITLPVDQISAVEGLIKPGDLVDIIGIFNLPIDQDTTETTVVNLFEGIKVLAVNRNFSPYRTEEQAETITLALRPDDVKVLTYSLQNGKIRLALRPPQDKTQEPGYSLVTMETLLRRLGRWAPPPVQKEDTVNIYRGSNRESIDIAQ